MRRRFNIVIAHIIVNKLIFNKIILYLIITINRPQDINNPIQFTDHLVVNLRPSHTSPEEETIPQDSTQSVMTAQEEAELTAHPIYSTQIQCLNHRHRLLTSKRGKSSKWSNYYLCYLINILTFSAKISKTE